MQTDMNNYCEELSGFALWIYKISHKAYLKSLDNGIYEGEYEDFMKIMNTIIKEIAKDLKNEVIKCKMNY